MRYFKRRTRMQRRVYALYLSPYSKLVIVLAAIFSTLLSILFLSGILSSTGSDAPPWWFGLLFIPISAFWWYPILYYPRRIVVIDETWIEFTSPLSRRKIDVSDIRSIAPHPYAMGILVLRYEEGRFGLSTSLTAFTSSPPR